MASSGVGGVSNSNLPEDLLVNILAKLPVKSLLRFKCVSKYWYALIESPNFISIHHNRNRTMLLVLHFVSLRDIMRDPDPDCPSDRIIRDFSGYDVSGADPYFNCYAPTAGIVSDDEFYADRFPSIADISDDEFYADTTSIHADTNSNRFAPIADISDDEFYADNSDENWDTKCNSDTNSFIYTDEDEAFHKEFALAVFRDDDILGAQPPPHEDIIDIIEIYGRGIWYKHAIIGPVDGLFLLHNGCGFGLYYNKLALWNPATTELRLIPLPDFNFPLSYSHCQYVFGFGLDPLTNNYKVVWIPDCGRIPSFEMPRPPNVALYSLGTNSWRHFNAVLPSVAKMSHYDSTYLNGAYYWLSDHVLSYEDKHIKVVLFDMSSDVFREIQIPDNVAHLNINTQDINLVLHNEDSIALLVCEYFSFPDHFLESIEMWVMKHDEEGCWTKLFTLGLDPLLKLEKPLGFWKNNYNEIIFRTATNKLVLYNTNTDEISDLGVQCDPIPYIVGYSPPIFKYKESLVSVGGQKECSKMGKKHAMLEDFLAFQPIRQ